MCSCLIAIPSENTLLLSRCNTSRKHRFVLLSYCKTSRKHRFVFFFRCNNFRKHILLFCLVAILPENTYCAFVSLQYFQKTQIVLLSRCNTSRNRRFVLLSHCNTSRKHIMCFCLAPRLPENTYLVVCLIAILPEKNCAFVSLQYLKNTALCFCFIAILPENTYYCFVSLQYFQKTRIRAFVSLKGASFIFKNRLSFLKDASHERLPG